MDLIPNVGSIDNRLAGHNPNKGKGKTTTKKSPNSPAHDQSAHDQHGHTGSDHTNDQARDTQLGCNIDTTA